MEKAAKDMVYITKQLLELTTRRKFEKRSLNINSVVQRVIGEIKSTSLPEGLVLEVDLVADPSSIEGTAERLATAIYHVCINGVEAVGHSGKVRVETRNVVEENRTTACGCLLDRGQYVKISISDTGLGVPPEIRDKLFEPFVTTKKAAGRRGAGLGLSVVYRIMLDHGGAVDFESSQGHGSMFVLYLPSGAQRGIEEGHAACSSSLRSDPVENVPCDRRRILIVDDEQTILRLFQMILSSGLPNRAIDLARDGQDAVRQFSEGHHAVLLMDLHMPAMDGEAAFLEIESLCKARNWEIPSIVFCTGFAPPDSVKNLVAKNPAHTLLSKPVSGETLVEAVKRRLVP
jgi:CheY-like chemotaxis protein